MSYKLASASLISVEIHFYFPIKKLLYMCIAIKVSDEQTYTATTTRPFINDNK